MVESTEDRGGTAALRRYRRRGWLWLLAAFVVLVPMVALIEHEGRRADALLRDGRRTSGTVTRYVAGDGGGSIVVRYRVSGVVRNATIDLTVRSPGYAVGQRVQVVYDPQDPGRVRTPAEPNLPARDATWLAWSIVAWLVLLGAGVTVFVRAARWRRQLERPGAPELFALAAPRGWLRRLSVREQGRSPLPPAEVRAKLRRFALGTALSGAAAIPCAAYTRGWTMAALVGVCFAGQTANLMRLSRRNAD